MLDKSDINIDEISRVFLFEDTSDRTFIIPYFCGCVMDSFYEKEPVFDYDHPVVRNQKFIYEKLKKSFYHGRLTCDCHDDRFSRLNGFDLAKVEEASIEEWIDYGPILIKNQCENCAGKGDLLISVRQTCDLCSGEGVIVNREKKDAALCAKCKGFGEVEKNVNKSCEKCSGLGFSPDLYILEYADISIECETYIEYGKYDPLNQTDIYKISCPSCDGDGDTLHTICTNTYTAKEWRSLSLVQSEMLRFSEDHNIEREIDSDTLQTLQIDYDECSLIKKILDFKKTCFVSGEFCSFIFDASHYPACEPGKSSTVSLEVKLKTYCGSCLGYRNLGIPYPGTHIKYTQYGIPAEGEIRLFRLKRMGA